MGGNGPVDIEGSGVFSERGPKPCGVSIPIDALLGLRCENGVDAAKGESSSK